MAPKSSEDKILARRFDLIKKMYLSDRVVAPVKKDKILDWFFCQFEIYGKNVSSLQYKLLWETFYDILLEEKISASGHRILIKSNSVGIFLVAIRNYPFELPWANIILSSISLFLETSTVNTTLIADLSKLLNLLMETLKIICKSYLTQTGTEQTLDEAEKLASIILDIIENLASSDEKIKSQTFISSFKSIACFFHISDSEKKFEIVAGKLIKQVTLVILSLKSKPYESLLSPATEAKSIEKSPALHFFSTLQNNLLSDELSYSKLPMNLSSAILMKKIVLHFIAQNKSSFQSLKVLSLFFAVNGLDVPIILDQKSCCQSLFKEKYLDGEINFLGLCHLLEACSALPQIFISVCEPEGFVKPSLWLQGVSTMLLSTKHTQNQVDWMKCFQHVLQITPTLVDCDIGSLIKTALLNISVNDSETREQYCELFKVIVMAHLQLHQMPKFFVKFLLALTECIKKKSGGTFIASGQFLPEIEEAVAKCIQEIPYGQMIEIWKMFISTFSTLENMSEVFMSGRSFIFLVAQLFSTFLLHSQLFCANIPSNINSQFKGLISHTSDEVEKNIFSFKRLDNVKFVPVIKSILLLSYAVGELKLAYNAYYEAPVDDSKYEVSDNIFNFSILHHYLNEDCAPILESYLDGSDKIMSVLVFQLLLQKVKAFQLRESLTEKETDHILSTISCILSHLQDSSALGPWDSDLCLVDETNYKTVMWRMFLKVFPLLVPSWSSKDFYSLSNLVQHILLEDKCFENGTKYAILSSLKNDVIQESKYFQTAIVSVIWKQECLLTCKKRSYAESEMEQSTTQRIFALLNAYHSKGLKYAERTPKSNKSLGSIWNEIKEVAELLNSVLFSDSLPKDKLVGGKLVDFLKLFQLLPLDYLLPANQMKCIIGLSFLLFLVPQSCKSEDRFLFTKNISLVLLSIFEGVRSIWLFDFVISGPYLKYIVKTLEAAITEECDDIDWAEQLIDYLISFTAKQAESLRSIEQYVTGLSTDQKCSRTVLIFYHSLLKKLCQLLPRSHNPENYREVLMSISSTTCTSFVKYMTTNFDKGIENKDHYYFIKCYGDVVEIMCCSTFQTADSFKKKCFKLLSFIPAIAAEKVSKSNVNSLVDVYLLFISKISKHCLKLSFFLPDDFESASWTIVLTHFEKKAQIKKEDTNCKGIIKDYVIDTMPCSICFYNCAENWTHFKTEDKNFKNVPFQNLFTLNDSEKECLQVLSTITDDEKLLEVFEHVSNKMGVYNSSQVDVSTFHVYLQIFQHLIAVNPEKCQQAPLNQCIQKCLTFLYSVMNEICTSEVCQTMILIPCLDFLSFVLAGNKGIPKHLLYQSLHCVVPVPVEVKNGDYELYSRSFTAAWNVVYELFTYQTAMILSSPSPFLAYVSKLLKSIVKTGAVEQLSKCSSSTLQKIQLCAQNMNRLLTVISRYKNEFAKLVPYLVADYVDIVQHITLESNIKESVLSGIYRLLDLCSEESIKMLAVNISYVGREIYENLVRNYKQNKYYGVT